MKLRFIFQTYLIPLSFIIFLAGCSSSRYLGKKETYVPSGSIPIRVLLSDKNTSLSYVVEKPVLLLNENKTIALVRKGNQLIFSADNDYLKLEIAGKIFSGKYFELKPQKENEFIYYRRKRYRGFLKFVPNGNQVQAINKVSLEDYLKGVVPAEMPVGVGDSYFQALKAFAICARTYTVMKLNENQSLFDVYLDTRDQVYGGADIEKDLSDKAIDDTRNLILTYNDKPAKVFYHAACGGHTENAKNVFGIKDAPYLDGVKDGDPPNCSIAPNFLWEEDYPENVFIGRLRTGGLLQDKNYKLKNVEVESRFESGRVSVLLITLTSGDGETQTVKLNGNKIRTVIRTADNFGILKSTMFNISLKDNGEVIITGKGNGHGVGLCQWGAIHQSIEGNNYKEILSFYFPGTAIKELK